MRDLISDTDRMTGTFRSSRKKPEMFFIRKNKVKRKPVKVGENLTDRAGRKFKNQFNSKRKSAGGYFPQAANLTKKLKQ